MRLRNGGIIRKGEYEGKTLQEAKKYAEDGGFITRVVENNGSSFMLTMDAKSNRINFRVRDNYVIDAYGG
jgi:hypothetical protein